MKNICTICASNKMIPDVTIVDQGQYSTGKLHLAVAGNPEAFLFKDKQKAELKAYICGECGVVQLKVEDPKALYEKYQKSLRSS